MVFKEPKQLSEMTLEEALQVLIAKAQCRECVTCIAHNSNWLPKADGCSCRHVGTSVRKAVEISNGFIEAVKRGVHFRKEPPKTSEVSRKCNALSYAQTISYMKRKGYTHCYMCGSDLEEDK